MKTKFLYREGEQIICTKPQQKISCLWILITVLTEMNKIFLRIIKLDLKTIVDNEKIS